MDFSNIPSENERRRERIKLTAGFEQRILELKEIEEFIELFSELSPDRIFSASNKIMFTPKNILVSAELTLSNIISCCENGSIADANTLLRKYRDDIFFYLYTTCFQNIRFDNNDKTIREMEDNISRWIHDDLSDLHITKIYQGIMKLPKLMNAAKDFALQNSFRIIGKQLNNFVHGNGYNFYNVYALDSEKFSVLLGKLINNAQYITTVFLFLIILVSPSDVMSSDYIDHLEMNMSPPSDSQYWVAPYVIAFLKKHSHIIDNRCYKYLMKNSEMMFDY